MLRKTLFIATALAVVLAGCGSDPETSPGAGGSGGGAAGSGGSGGDGGTGGGGGGTGGSEDGPVRIDVSVDPDRICIESCLQVDVGETVLLVATAVDANDEPVDGIEFAWSSGDESLATVDAEGNVTGIADGWVTIVASSGDLSGTLDLHVGKSKIAKLQVFPVNADVAPAVLAGRTLQVTVAAFADAWGMNVVRDPELSWTATPESLEVVRIGARDDGSLLFELKGDEAGPASVTFGSPDAEEGVEGTVEFTLLAGTALAGEAAFDSIAVGGESACGVSDGALSCWGGNFLGQLGLGEDGPPEPFPMAVELAEVATVSAGQISTCAITGAGEAYCWGSNALGILGVAEPDGQVEESFAPVPVAGGHAFASIAVGANHACALDTAGAAWCWGANFSGELGMGPGGEQWARQPARVATDVTFTAIRPGGGFTCALDVEGKAWCWGSTYGALGFVPDEGEISVPVPAKVAGDRSYVALAASFGHVCAVDEDGVAWCWGQNFSGELGSDAGGDESFAREPVRVPGDRTWTSIAAASFHTCALDAAGAAWCWGGNQNGALGDGGLVSSLAPVQVHGDHVFAAIAANGTTTCAVEAEGFAYCWGSSSVGQLGCGLVDTMRPIPMPVSLGTEER